MPTVGMSQDDRKRLIDFLCAQVKAHGFSSINHLRQESKKELGWEPNGATIKKILMEKGLLTEDTLRNPVRAPRVNETQAAKPNAAPKPLQVQVINESDVAVLIKQLHKSMLVDANIASVTVYADGRVHISTTEKYQL